MGHTYQLSVASECVAVYPGNFYQTVISKLYSPFFCWQTGIKERSIDFKEAQTSIPEERRDFYIL